MKGEGQSDKTSVLPNQTVQVVTADWTDSSLRYLKPEFYLTIILPSKYTTKSAIKFPGHLSH